MEKVAANDEMWNETMGLGKFWRSLLCMFESEIF